MEPQVPLELAKPWWKKAWHCIDMPGRISLWLLDKWLGDRPTLGVGIVAGYIVSFLYIMMWCIIAITILTAILALRNNC
jgi:hypothetical protein